MIISLFSFSSFAQLGWVQVPSPNPSATRNMVRGISGTSSSDVWAVGSYEEVLTVPPYNIQNELLLHWNGSDWQQYPSLHLSTTLDDLYDVEAISANNVWAVGNYNQASVRSEILHFDGSSWTNINIPQNQSGSYLYSLHAINANDIWAAGGQGGSPIRPAYTIHYNGSSWTEVTVPPVGAFRTAFYDIHGVASNDVWAVGHWGDTYGDYHALAMHWNGSAWINVALPSAVTSQLSEILAVKMVSANDVWAVGAYLTGGMFKIHWDGTAWTEVTPTNGGGGQFAVKASNNIFGVGNEISHWDGTAWTIVDNLSQLSYPSLASTVVFNNGEIWAGGRTIDASNNFQSLIYRSVDHVPGFSSGNTQAWTVNKNSNNNTLGNILLTSDADVSQRLSYSVVAAPSHGSLSGLPATAITNSGSALPAGVSYTPVAGFSGSDQFVIRVAAGNIYSESTINVTVTGTLASTLVDFNVSKTGTNALVSWTTATESNAKSFEILHSTDGINFTSVGTVAAQGNSSISHSYSFTHYSPATGNNYYKLKLTDFDGQVTFYPVKLLQVQTNILSAVVLLKNPATGNTIPLQFNESGKWELSLYSLQGQKFVGATANISSSGTLYNFNLPNIGKGIYLLRAMNGKSTEVIKVLVN
jgi:hypothetical protein